MALTALSTSAASAWSQSFRLSGTDSQAAPDLLQHRFPTQAGGSADIVFKAPAGVATPDVRSRLDALFARIAAVSHVAEVASPFAPGGARQISGDGTIGYAQVSFDVDTQKLSPAVKAQLVSSVSSANGGGLQVDGGGQAFTAVCGPGGTEAIGLVAAVVILLIAFGSLLAMGLPILTARFGIGVGFAVVGLISHLTSVPDSPSP